MCVFILSQAACANETPADEGRAIFLRKCAPCHGTGPGIDGSEQLPGTAALARKYKGELPAALEQRDDLTVEILRYFIRHGVGAMPMFRKTDISDEEIELLADYLGRSAAGSGQQQP